MASKIIFPIFAGVCVFAVWGSFRLDVPVREAVVEAQGKGWKKSAGHRFHATVRTFGDWPPLMLASGAGLLLARWRGNRRWMRILAAAMVASTLAGVIANAARLTTGRTRPRESIEQGFYGPWHDGRLLIGQPAYNSFPSGHTATAFGFAAVIVFAAPAWGILAMAGACVVAWSSIAMGAHHPSDVVTSVILSSLVAWFVWRGMRGRLAKFLRLQEPVP